MAPARSFPLAVSTSALVDGAGALGPPVPPVAFFRDSDEWAWINAWLLKRIDELRTDLESPSLTPDATAAIRGRLSELRHTLALPNEAALATRAAPDLSGAARFDPFSLGSVLPEG